MQSSSLSTTSLRTSPLFGNPLEELVPRSGYTQPQGAIPVFMTQTIEYLQENAIHVPGLFRIAGSVKRIDALKKAWEFAYDTEFNHGPVDFSPFNVHDVAAVLKSFLRELPEPLFIYRYYRPMIALHRLKSKDEQVTCIRLVISLLPPVHRHTLEKLMRFLKRVSECSEDKDGVKGNLMTATNLAVCIGPNILRDKPSEPQDAHLKNRPKSTGATASTGSLTEFSRNAEVSDSSAVVDLVSLMIDRADDVFSVRSTLMLIVFHK
jgi:hypothetical protein